MFVSSDHVAEIVCRLHDSTHSCLREEIIDGINVDIECGAASTGEGSPVPTIIFSVQQNVSGNDRDTDGHNDQNQKHEKHKTIHLTHTENRKKKKKEETHTRREQQNKAAQRKMRFGAEEESLRVMMGAIHHGCVVCCVCVF